MVLERLFFSFINFFRGNWDKNKKYYTLKDQARLIMF